ncbi:MAG: M1 family metallopeptidase [Planctomycetaceae bacterium]
MFRLRPALWAAALFLTLGTERAALDAGMPERSARVVSYTIRARLVPQIRTVQGSMDLLWRNASGAPVDHLYVHLYLNAFKDKESTFLRETRGDHRGEEWDAAYPGSLTVRSMRTADGKELWTDATRAFEAPDDGNEKDATLARVQLPGPIAPGETLQLAVEFESLLPRVSARTGWAGDPDEPLDLFFMVAQWFPKVAALKIAPDGAPSWNRHQFHGTTEFFADYGSYQVEITVPRNFVVGATGARTNSVANADETVTYVHRQEDVHDFAWCASPHFVEKSYRWDLEEFLRAAPMGEAIRGVLERAAKNRGVARESIQAPPVQVRFLLQKDHVELLDRLQWSTGAALACFGIWYGAYPYETLTVVDPPDGGGGAGGMEYPTLVTTWCNRLAPSFDWSMESVTVHEFGHQHFYGLLGSNEFEEAWLDEGLTSFGEARTMEESYGAWTANTRYGLFRTPQFRPFAAPKVFGRLSSLLRFPAWLGKIPKPWSEPEELLPVPEEEGLFAYLRDMPFLHLPSGMKVPQPLWERRGVLSTRSEDAMVASGWHFARDDDYWVNSYDKPVLLLYCLRGLMGEEAFDRAMYAYCERHRFGHPTTADFVKSMTEGGGEAVEGFLRAMTDTAAMLDVAVLEASNRELPDKSFEWTVKVQRRGTIPVPVEIWAEAEGGGERLLLETWRGAPRETTRTLQVRREKRLAAVRLGPSWLRNIDKEVSNDALRADKSADTRAATALAVQWTFFVEEAVRAYAGVAR